MSPTPARPLRFGDVAVAMGFLSRERVDRALAIQAAEEAAGRPHRLLGEVLRAKGWLGYAECCAVVDHLVELARAQQRRGGAVEWTLVGATSPSGA